MPKEVIGSTLRKDTLIYPRSENPISILSVYRPLYSVPPFTNTKYYQFTVKGTHNNSNKIIFARFPRQ